MKIIGMVHADTNAYGIKSDTYLAEVSTHELEKLNLSLTGDIQHKKSWLGVSFNIHDSYLKLCWWNRRQSEFEGLAHKMDNMADDLRSTAKLVERIDGESKDE